MANVTAWKRAIIDRIWIGPVHIREKIRLMINTHKITDADVRDQAAAYAMVAEAMGTEFTMGEIEKITQTVLEALEMASANTKKDVA